MEKRWISWSRIVPEDLRRFFFPIGGIKKLYVISWLAFSTWTFYDLLNVYFLGKIISVLEAGAEVASLQSVLLWYLGLILVAHLFCYLAKEHHWPKLVESVQKVLHRHYLDKYIHLDVQYCELVGTGKTISIIDKGLHQRGLAINEFNWKVSRLLITLAYISRGFVQLGWRFLLMFWGVLAIGALVAYFINFQILRERRERVYAANDYTKERVRIVMSKVEIMQSYDKSKEVAKLDNPIDRKITANLKTAPYMHWFFFGPRLAIDLGRIGLFALVIFGSWQAGGGLGTIVSLGGALIMLDLVLDSLLEFYKNVTKDFDVIKRMWDFFDHGKPAITYDQGDTFVMQEGEIVLDKVVFAYMALGGDKTDEQSSSPVFSDFTLQFAGGKKTALVGVSGSGKSTLVKLVTGYLRPNAGSVVIDGQNLQDVSLKSYYRHIGYLTQEPAVFDGTIKENLLYACADEVSDEEMHAALSMANCDFVVDLAQGLDTEIGERGVRLSGGQRQRLAIAKVFLKNPEIVILDEPTSALDSFSEEAITEAMHKLFAGRTVIIIAHRLQTVKQADDIIVLDAGKVKERGTHDELVAQGGFYAKMLELQSGF